MIFRKNKLELRYLWGVRVIYVKQLDRRIPTAGTKLFFILIATAFFLQLQ